MVRMVDVVGRNRRRLEALVVWLHRHFSAANDEFVRAPLLMDRACRFYLVFVVTKNKKLPDDFRRCTVEPLLSSLDPQHVLSYQLDITALPVLRIRFLGNTVH